MTRPGRCIRPFGSRLTLGALSQPTISQSRPKVIGAHCIDGQMVGLLEISQSTKVCFMVLLGCPYSPGCHVCRAILIRPYRIRLQGPTFSRIYNLRRSLRLARRTGLLGALPGNNALNLKVGLSDTRPHAADRDRHPERHDQRWHVRPAHCLRRGTGARPYGRCDPEPIASILAIACLA